MRQKEPQHLTAGVWPFGVGVRAFDIAPRPRVASAMHQPVLGYSARAGVVMGRVNATSKVAIKGTVNVTIHVIVSLMDSSGKAPPAACDALLLALRRALA